MMQMKHFMVAAFGAVLLAPNLLFPILKTEADTGTKENRTLAEFPSLTPDTLESFPSDTELFINDHAAFRNRFLNLNSFLNLKLFGYADSLDVIKGKDGWYFYAAGTSVEDYLGINGFSPEQLSSITEKFRTVQEKLREQGTELILLFPPNKEGIYSEYLPDGFAPAHSPTRREALIENLRRETTIPVADPAGYFLSNREYQWYFKTDTHWNDAAGFIASQMLIEAAGGDAASIEDIQVVYTDGEKGDLANLFHMPDSFFDDAKAEIYGYYDELPLEVSDELGDGNRVHYTSPQSPDARRISVYRDSFGTALAPALSRYFRQTDFYHWQAFDASLLSENRPDILVYEVVERELGRVLWDLGKILGEE